VSGENQFYEKLAEADGQFHQNGNGKTLHLQDLEILFQARGDECPLSIRKKTILEQWEVVQTLPVTWAPWMEANNKELEELLHIFAEMDD
jgi:hypothetical protein